eukprot:759816-Hanusia_phi.AAC.1
MLVQARAGDGAQDEDAPQPVGACGRERALAELADKQEGVGDDGGMRHVVGYEGGDHSENVFRQLVLLSHICHVEQCLRKRVSLISCTRESWQDLKNGSNLSLLSDQPDNLLQALVRFLHGCELSVLLALLAHKSGTGLPPLPPPPHLPHRPTIHIEDSGIEAANTELLRAPRGLEEDERISCESTRLSPDTTLRIPSHHAAGDPWRQRTRTPNATKLHLHHHTSFINPSLSLSLPPPGLHLGDPRLCSL